MVNGWLVPAARTSRNCTDGLDRHVRMVRTWAPARQTGRLIASWLPVFDNASRAAADRAGPRVPEARLDFGVTVSPDRPLSDSSGADGCRFEKSIPGDAKDVLPQPRQIAKTAPHSGGRAGLVTNRTEKSAVKPLTRLASRSEIRHN